MKVGYIFAALIACVTSIASAQRSTPLQVLHPAGAASDQFGQSVAIDDDTMIVGAPQDDVGANSNQGSAHVYRWTGSGWTLEATLIAGDGAANDQFGTSVAIDGDTAIVGSRLDTVDAVDGQGSAYVFTRLGSNWVQQAKLTASDGASFDSFGSAVDIDNDTVVVGAGGDDIGTNSNQGSAYVFTRSGSTWGQQTKLTASDGSAGDAFGVSVAIDADTIVVGAYANMVVSQNVGSAYVFSRVGSNWSQQSILNASDGTDGDFFGISVAIDGDSVVVGADRDDLSKGSVYVFTRFETSWTQQS
ncbi:MAG: FG-GAP repeat protein, partial [Phycisphaerales bacterium]